MPIYEYKCRECDHRLEKLQKLSDAPLTQCPACGKEALTKLISAAGFRLKGAGWYETDFKKDGKRNLAGDDGGKSSGKDGGGEGPKVESAKTRDDSAKTKSEPQGKSESKGKSESTGKSESKAAAPSGS